MLQGRAWLASALCSSRRMMCQLFTATFLPHAE
jgi:hypothetical protein